MIVYRVKRSDEICGEYEEWLVDKVFSTREKAEEYIKNHPLSITTQEIIQQRMN